MKDWHIFVVMIGLVTISTFVFSGSGNFAEEMLGTSFIVGGIILLGYRIIKNRRKKLEEKKQAV